MDYYTQEEKRLKAALFLLYTEQETLNNFIDTSSPSESQDWRLMLEEIEDKIDTILGDLKAVRGFGWFIRKSDLRISE